MIRRWYQTTFVSLQDPNYRILWTGSMFSMLAFMMSFTVQAVVAFELEGTNSAVGLVALGFGASMVILGPMGGVIADRVSKRPLVFVGQMIVAAALFATGLLLVLGGMTIIWLTLLTAVMGLAFTFLGPARQAWVGEMVPPRNLANAVALGQLSMNISRVAAPLLAGLMIGSAAIGSGGTYIFMASLYGIVLLTVYILPPTKAKPAHERRAVTTELRAGVRYVARHSALRVLMLPFLAIVVIGFAFQIVLPALLERHLDREATDIGLILTVNAVAALVVSVGLAGMVGTKWAWPLMLGCGVLLGLGFLLLSAAPSFEFALLAMVVMGPGLSGFMLINNSLIMANTSPAYFGRVMSLTMLAFGVQGVLSLPTGILADAIGERQILVVAGIAVLIVVALGSAAYAALGRSGALRADPVSALSAVAAPRRVLARPHGIAMVVGQKSGESVRLATGSGD